MSSKAWGGRFQQQPEDWVDEFNASIDFDQTLLDEDVQGSIHATMLGFRNIRAIKGKLSIHKDFHTYLKFKTLFDHSKHPFLN